MEEKMAEETAEQISADDWGAAMAEQAATPEPTAQPHVFEQLGGTGSATTHNDLDMILDIPVQLTVELGRTKMPIKNLLQLAQGSVVELAGMAGEPLDVLINGFLIAQGEVVVVNDKLGIRLTDIITPSERLRRINK
jgi:flagellar motor switch protein FliN/FliY